jgi:hypothetical protein
MDTVQSFYYYLKKLGDTRVLPFKILLVIIGGSHGTPGRTANQKKHQGL